MISIILLYALNQIYVDYIFWQAHLWRGLRLWEDLMGNSSIGTGWYVCQRSLQKKIHELSAFIFRQQIGVILSNFHQTHVDWVDRFPIQICEKKHPKLYDQQLPTSGCFLTKNCQSNTQTLPTYTKIIWPYHTNIWVFPRGGPPKWMVKIMENPMNKWMIWGVFPLFLETPIYQPSWDSNIEDLMSPNQPTNPTRSDVEKGAPELPLSRSQEERWTHSWERMWWTYVINFEKINLYKFVDFTILLFIISGSIGRF